MENYAVSDDHISETENPLPENVKSLISAKVFKEITEKDKEKEKRE